MRDAAKRIELGLDQQKRMMEGYGLDGNADHDVIFAGVKVYVSREITPHLGLGVDSFTLANQISSESGKPYLPIID